MHQTLNHFSAPALFFTPFAMKTFICLVALLGVASALPSSFKVAGGPADVRGAWAGPGDDSYSAGVQGKKGYAYGTHSSTGAYTTEIGES